MLPVAASAGHPKCSRARPPVKWSCPSVMVKVRSRRMSAPHPYSSSSANLATRRPASMSMSVSPCFGHPPCRSRNVSVDHLPTSSSVGFPDQCTEDVVHTDDPSVDHPSAYPSASRPIRWPGPLSRSPSCVVPISRESVRPSSPLPDSRPWQISGLRQQNQVPCGPLRHCPTPEQRTPPQLQRRRRRAVPECRCAPVALQSRRAVACTEHDCAKCSQTTRSKMLPRRKCGSNTKTDACAKRHTRGGKTS